MSKPAFSRKRKGKVVDPYPLGSKEKGKSTQTKGNRGRPRKAKEAPSPETEELTLLKSFTNNVLMFQDVDDVLSGRNDEWLDLDKEDWEEVIVAVDNGDVVALRSFLDKIMRFQEVDDVIDGRIEEWLDMEQEEWLDFLAKLKMAQAKGGTSTDSVEQTKAVRGFLGLYKDLIHDDYTLEDVENDLIHISELAEQLAPTLSEEDRKRAEAWAEAYVEDEETEELQDPYVRLVALDLTMKEGDYIWDDFGDEAVLEIVEVVGNRLAGAAPPSPGPYSVGDQVKIGNKWWKVLTIDKDGELELDRDDVMITMDLAPKDFKKISETRSGTK